MPDYLEQFRGMNSATLIFRPCLAIFSAVPVDAVMVTRQITRNRPAPDPIHVAPGEPHLFFPHPSGKKSLAIVPFFEAHGFVIPAETGGDTPFKLPPRILLTDGISF